MKKLSAYLKGYRMAFRESKILFLDLGTLKMRLTYFGDLDCLKGWFPVSSLVTYINGLRVALTKDLLVLGMAIFCLAVGKRDRICLREQY
ncbi:hypothetical protein TNIN_217301 [Trichonephila inaurata madagascariensis]|uniref:Uncharacterized protein n=1 Tax=Trichonephila inaurata madagascariensis TaxID=2747483 RepID=A0A8X6WLC3_9ARAC|nr:hypothetical protein TNIN_217301 [Trichonephila inaurata madagascariensis]